jgi:hypothetical protein
MFSLADGKQNSSDDESRSGARNRIPAPASGSGSGSDEVKLLANASAFGSCDAGLRKMFEIRDQGAAENAVFSVGCDVPSEVRGKDLLLPGAKECERWTGLRGVDARGKHFGFVRVEIRHRRRAPERRDLAVAKRLLHEEA